MLAHSYGNVVLSIGVITDTSMHEKDCDSSVVEKKPQRFLD